MTYDLFIKNNNIMDIKEISSTIKCWLGSFQHKINYNACNIEQTKIKFIKL
jgi:hypothetical protein